MALLLDISSVYLPSHANHCTHAYDSHTPLARSNAGNESLCLLSLLVKQKNTNDDPPRLPMRVFFCTHE
ncbi:hypothetical protein [Rubritalea tangerina]|uniref:hypothetical protein n=1 Tax=Rubritalea tangerina TaxID=430798 RepID=UPI00361F6BE6